MLRLFSELGTDLVRTWYEEGAREKEVFSCTINSLYSWFLSLFPRKKEKQKKLAAADKYAKIMILSLNKKNSLRSDSFLFLTLQTHNFLTLFIRGGRDYF